MVLASGVVDGLDVASGGVRMPTSELASLRMPQTVVEQPVTRTGNPVVGNAFLPTLPSVPVYRRKQARH